MNTRRFRLVRPKWTMGTMLLIVGWSAVVVCLNVRPRISCDRSPSILFGRKIYALAACTQDFGCPWIWAKSVCLHSPYDPCPPPHSPLRDPCEYDYRALAANIAIGLLAVAVLTFASRYLLRVIAAGLRAVFGKPPPSKGKALPNCEIHWNPPTDNSNDPNTP